MARLKPGPGVQAVESDCSTCHSTDYIVRQPGGDAQHWEPEVRKMVKVFGAPLSEADIQTIVQYLASEYGPAASTPAQPRSGQKPLSH
jgi:sulfite dehydrogenase (cytochrome) subunit B